MRVVPLGDKLVVKRLEPDPPGPGDLLLPESTRGKPQQGRVLSVGDGRLLPSGQRAPHDVHEGDRVVFGAYAGSEVAIDDNQLLILRADDVLAIVR